MATPRISPFFTPRPGRPGSAPAKKYPFRELQVGHYFDVPRDLDHAVRVRASQQGKLLGRTYSVRRVNDQCVRVYRIR